MIACLSTVIIGTGSAYRFHIKESASMVRAWYMDTIPGDQRLEHRPHDATDVSLEQLAGLGVLYWKVGICI